MATTASLRSASLRKNFASLRAPKAQSSRKGQVVRALATAQRSHQSVQQHVAVAGALVSFALLAPGNVWADDTLPTPTADEITLVAESKVVEQVDIQKAPELVAEVPSSSEVAAVSDAEPVAAVSDAEPVSAVSDAEPVTAVSDAEPAAAASTEPAAEVASSESAPESSDKTEAAAEEAPPAEPTPAVAEETSKVEEAPAAPEEPKVETVAEETKAEEPVAAAEVVEVVAEPAAAEAAPVEVTAVESTPAEEAPKAVTRHVLTPQEKEVYERIEETIEKIESVIEPLEDKIEALPESRLQARLEKQLEVMEEDLGKAEQLLDGAQDFQKVEQLTNSLFQQIKSLAAAVGIKL